MQCMWGLWITGYPGRPSAGRWLSTAVLFGKRLIPLTSFGLLPFAEQTPVESSHVLAGAPFIPTVPKSRHGAACLSRQSPLSSDL